MATVYFTASSLDGYIVDETDSLDWLVTRDVDADGPFGYEAFMKSIGALVMGSATYEWMVQDQPGDVDVRAAVMGADPPPAHHRRRPSRADVRR